MKRKRGVGYSPRPKGFCYLLTININAFFPPKNIAEKQTNLINRQMINFLNTKDKDYPFTLIFGTIKKGNNKVGKIVIKSITGIIKFRKYNEAEYVGEQLTDEGLQENYTIILEDDYTNIIFSHE